MENTKKIIKYIVIAIFSLFILWFLFLKNTKITIRYDDDFVAYNDSYSRIQSSQKLYKSNTNMSLSNVLSPETVNADNVESEDTQERYKENRYYKVDTTEFDVINNKLKEVISYLGATIKINEQKSKQKNIFEKEFYPRLQTIEFTVQNDVKNIEQIEEVLKQYGSIRQSHTNQESVEQELLELEQRLREIEESRKVLQDSKDSDWIVKKDSDLVKQSEKIKSQIENTKNKTYYKTYDIDIYEVIYANVNSIRYWYENNYSVKDAIQNMIPQMISLLSKLVPCVLILLIFVYIFNNINREFKKKIFKDKLETIKEMKTENIHFDIKM